MSTKALHLNLLNPQERHSSSPVRAKMLLPIIGGSLLAFVLIHAVILGIEYAIVSSRVSSLRASIAAITAENNEISALKATYRNLQAEADQFDFYVHARCARGDLLRRLAFAIPDGISLAELSIPAPPDQQLRPPLGAATPPLQGPTQTVERVELRLKGLAKSEQDVFKLMGTLRDKEFKDLVMISEKNGDPENESPRVLSFKQESKLNGGQRGVYFDIVYLIKPREFVK